MCALEEILIFIPTQIRSYACRARLSTTDLYIGTMSEGMHQSGFVRANSDLHSDSNFQKLKVLSVFVLYHGVNDHHIYTMDLSAILL